MLLNQNTLHITAIKELTPTAKFRFENGNGYDNLVWLEEDLICLLEIRVKGIFEGSTIDKYFDMHVDTFYIDKNGQAFVAR